jgi:hypothetical protein
MKSGFISLIIVFNSFALVTEISFVPVYCMQRSGQGRSASVMHCGLGMLNQARSGGQPKTLPFIVSH